MARSMTRLITIDCDYLQPELACAYLRIEGGEAAFIETNTAHAVPRLLAALDAEGLAKEDVKWIVITHVHLDHSGGASALVKACPNAIVLAHPRAARHLIDPSKLVASATTVYGAERFSALYGTIEPIAAARVRSMDDGSEVQLGDAPLRFIHTRGHANHHFVVHDPKRSTVYTGDAFGLLYPRLQRNGVFAFPSTSPTDFDAPAAHQSVDTIAGLGTDSVCLTHFGESSEVRAIAEQLHHWLDFAGGLVQEGSSIAQSELESTLKARLHAEMKRQFASHGLADPADQAFVDFDLDLNAQGLAFVIEKARASA